MKAWKKAAIVAGLFLIFTIGFDYVIHQKAIIIKNVTVNKIKNSENEIPSRKIGTIRIREDGLPGYDLNKDGVADYLSSGLDYYQGLYEKGGFYYESGEIELEEFKIKLLLPSLQFEPQHLGSDSVSFRAKDIRSNVIIFELNTHGASLFTYNLYFFVEGEDLIIMDRLFTEGRGVIEEGEVTKGLPFELDSAIRNPILNGKAPITKDGAENKAKETFIFSQGILNDRCGLHCEGCGVKRSYRNIFGYYVDLEYACGPSIDSTKYRQNLTMFVIHDGQVLCPEKKENFCIRHRFNFERTLSIL